MQALLQEILARSGTAQLPADQPNHKRLACHVTLLKQLLQVGVFGPLQVSNSSNVLLVSNVYPVAFLWTNISKLSHVVLIDLRALAPEPCSLCPLISTHHHHALVCCLAQEKQLQCYMLPKQHICKPHTAEQYPKHRSYHITMFRCPLAHLLVVYLDALYACLRAVTDSLGKRCKFRVCRTFTICL